MKLSGVDSSVEVYIDGYESEAIPGDVPQPGSTWLVVRAVVVSNGAAHTYRSISLDLGDAEWLGEWMHAVCARTTVPVATSSTSYPYLAKFAEPELYVELLGLDSSSVTTRWHFYDPSAPVASIDGLELNVRAVDVRVSNEAFDAARKSWISDLAGFPDR